MSPRRASGAHLALLLLALLCAVQGTEAIIAYDVQKPWKLLNRHALRASLAVLLGLDYWFCVVVYVLLAVSFWHCERYNTAVKAGKQWPGGGFCRAGQRQEWPGEFASLSNKSIETVHFWAQLPVVNNYLTSLLVFTLSFFNQQAYSTWTAGLGAASKAGSALHNVCYHCLSFLNYDRAKGRNLMRFCHAFNHVSWGHFGGKLGNPHFWEMLKDRNLLTAAEVNYLNGKGSPLPPGAKKQYQVLAWATQFVAQEVRDGNLSPFNANLLFNELMALRAGCGSLTTKQENPLPYFYFFAVNVLLYCWAVSVGLFFSGFLSIYGGIAYALVVYIFFMIRNIGIELSEPFGYEDRHLAVPEYLMRGFQDHKDLLADGLSPLTASDASAVDGSRPPEFNAPFEAKYDRAFMAQYKKNSAAVEMLSLSQSRFGLPGITEEDRDKGLHV